MPLVSPFSSILLLVAFRIICIGWGLLGGAGAVGGTGGVGGMGGRGMGLGAVGGIEGFMVGLPLRPVNLWNVQQVVWWPLPGLSTLKFGLSAPLRQEHYRSGLVYGALLVRLMVLCNTVVVMVGSMAMLLLAAPVLHLAT